MKPCPKNEEEDWSFIWMVLLVAAIWFGLVLIGIDHQIPWAGVTTRVEDLRP